ncbi:prepilin peptidase [Tuanshanicoccus lijuaniae]|uniref:prepilin peptidase n=1 Tax=Aerococcaceae bacterium zg-1292 TaxID=2774330 RepID=UPI001BD89F3B|nr:prepilin peptidase [Aerococcaceae bacterium zg-BR9]MBF6979285.1 prepilin peptidase [Aerococcaceae bacterium zg-BR22]MBS4456937.1 prepilin peptidase [Aerococcaceae bacterium zg-A91]MBS4458797.1 prepilin peptidase [Aerococcaceae bacterium zg-BR33]
MLLLFFSGAILASFYTHICEHNTLFHSKHSHCDFCHTPLKWRQLIPIFSTIYYRKTPCCQQPLSYHYLLIELWSSWLFLGMYPILLAVSTTHATLLLTLVSVLLLLAIYDAVYMEVAWVMLLIVFVLSAGIYYVQPQNWVFSLCLWLILEGIIVIQPQWLGGADSKLLTSLSLTLPLQAVPILLAAASATGLLWIAIRKTAGRSTHNAIPFIPCIVTGYVLALLFA